METSNAKPHPATSPSCSQTIHASHWPIPQPTKMARCARNKVSSRCIARRCGSHFACSITYDAPLRRESFHLPASCPRARMPVAHARRVGAVIGFVKCFQVFQRAHAINVIPGPHPPAPCRLPCNRTSSPAALGLPSRTRWTTHLHWTFTGPANRPGSSNGFWARRPGMKRKVSLTGVCDANEARKLAPAKAGSWF